jgi:hypothetical protein
VTLDRARANDGGSELGIHLTMNGVILVCAFLFTPSLPIPWIISMVSLLPISFVSQDMANLLPRLL